MMFRFFWRDFRFLVHLIFACYLLEDAGESLQGGACASVRLALVLVLDFSAVSNEIPFCEMMFPARVFI